MSVKKYKFVSPGVFVSEIDNSQLPELETAAGPVIIGRAQRGPGLRPVQINSFAEFVNVFGDPTAVGTQTDAWRAGDSSAPLYAVYAAQAWLRNNSPITFVRLLGDEDPNKASGGEAGWYTRETAGTFNGVAADGAGARRDSRQTWEPLVVRSRQPRNLTRSRAHSTPPRTHQSARGRTVRCRILYPSRASPRARATPPPPPRRRPRPSS